MSLGAIVAVFGLAIFLGSLVTFVFPAIMFLRANFLTVPHEEDRLKNIFGKEYLDYMKRVRKWTQRHRSGRKKESFIPNPRPKRLRYLKSSTLRARSDPQTLDSFLAS